jgi:hypothetical protein
MKCECGHEHVRNGQGICSDQECYCVMAFFAPHYSPIMLCETHRMSFHADAEHAHRQVWYSPEFPCKISMCSKESHAAAGWDVSQYPDYIS